MKPVMISEGHVETVSQTCFEPLWIPPGLRQPAIAPPNGSAKQGQGYTYHGSIKEVYLYVLDARFREHIGCQQKPYSPAIRSSHTLTKWEGQQMMIKDTLVPEDITFKTKQKIALELIHKIAKI